MSAPAVAPSGSNERQEIIGRSELFLSALRVLQLAAPSKASILLLGESGTGKELLAQRVHELSPRREGPFVKLHCAALCESLLESELFGHERGAFTGAVVRKEGRFGLADGGTLFLDEIGELPASVQVKLLRFLQSREFERVGGIETIRVDVRLITATHRDLAAEVRAGRFREDLFYRLNVVCLQVPPLRDRSDDIPALSDYFLGRFSAEYRKPLRGFSPAARAVLANHAWPGNVRELENAIEAAVALAQGELIEPGDLPARIVQSSARPAPVLARIGSPLHEIEREAILRTLASVGGSTSKAAKVLGISIRTLQYRLREYSAGQRDAKRSSLEPSAPLAP